MNAPRIAALAAVLLIVYAPLARAEVNNVISEVSTARLKAIPGSNNGTKGRNNAPISTTRSNIKHAIPQQPAKLPTCQPGKKC